MPRLRELGAVDADLAAALPGQRIDLAVLNRADPLFLDRVMRKSRLLAGSSRRYADLRLYAFPRYQARHGHRLCDLW